jgi:hypothetical protein
VLEEAMRLVDLRGEFLSPRSYWEWRFDLTGAMNAIELWLNSNLAVDAYVVVPSEVSGAVYGGNVRAPALVRPNSTAVSDLVWLPDPGPWVLVVANRSGAPAFVHATLDSRHLWPAESVGGEVARPRR